MEKEKEFDPFKVLSKSTYDQKFTSPMSKTTESGSGDMYGYNVGLGSSKYDKNLSPTTSIEFNDFVDSLEDYRSKNQPWIDKAGAGLARVGLKVGVELAKMPGFIGGAIAAPFAEEGQGWETFVNNSWVKSLNNLNQKINNEYLPVYVKKAVAEGNLWANITSIDFWATDGADGIGYIVSMMAPGAILKGIGVGNKLAKLGANEKLLKVLNRADPLLSAQKGDVITATIANTMFESAAEAGNAMENFDKTKDTFIQSQLSKGLTAEEAEQTFTEQKARLGRDIFIANTAILMGPNALQSNMLWGRTVNKTATEVFDKKGTLLQNVINPQIYKKVSRRLGDIGKATISEGLWEEGMQMSVEHMFTNSAKKGQLTNNMFNDFNLGELGDAYLNTISSTEGLKAMFLGAFLGGGMQAFSGGKQDIRDRKATQSLLDVAHTSIDSYYKALTENVYNEDGSVNVTKARSKVAALKNLETLDEMYQNALAKGDFEVLEELRDIAGSQLAMGFIMNDKLGLEVLRKHLEESTQLEEVLQKEQELGNKVSKKDIVERVMSKATLMENALSNFQKFAPSLYNPTFKDESLTEEVKQQKTQEFRKVLAQNYLTNKVVKDIYNKKIKELEKDKAQILADLGYSSSVNLDLDNYTVDIEQANKVDKDVLETSDERLRKVTEDLKELKEEFQQVDKLDKLFWNKERIQKDFDKYNNQVKKDEKAVTPEKLEQYDSVLGEIAEIESIKELESYARNLKEEYQTNPVILDKLAEHKVALETALELKKAKEEADVIQEDEEQFEQDEVIGTTTVNTDTKSATDITIVTDLETLQNSETSEVEDTIEDPNNFLELKENTNPEFSDKNQSAARIISTYQDTGESIPGLESFVEYEKETRNKTNDKVTFSLGDLTQQKQDQLMSSILDKLKNDGTLNDKQIEMLENYLLIKVTLSNGTKSASSFIDSMSHPNPDIVTRETLPLRKAIIKALVDNQGSFEGIEGKVDKQFTGVLKIGEQGGSILNLAVFEGMTEKEKINYFKKNTIYVGNKGMVKHTATDLPVHNLNLKARSKGEVFLLIPMINGEMFPLKLNTNKLSDEKASATLDLIILRSRLLSQKQDMTFDELQEYITNNDLGAIQTEFDFVKREEDNIDQTLERLINFIVFSQNTNTKTRLELKPNGVLLLGELLHKFNDKLPAFDGDKVKHYYYTNEILESLSGVQRQSLIDYLKYKRHNVLITKDGNATFNNDAYIKYLLGTETGYSVLSTNAITNEPTFQGYSNIYLSQSVTNKTEPKIKKAEDTDDTQSLLDSLNYGNIVEEPITTQSEIEAKKADIERRLGIKLPVKNTSLPVSSKTWGDRKSLANQLSSELKGVVERGVSMQEWLDKGYGRQLATWTDETIIEFLEVADIEKRRQEKLEAYKLKKDGTPKNEAELTKVYAIDDVRIINAKYDAELKTLETQNVLPTANINQPVLTTESELVTKFNSLSETQQLETIETLAEKLNKPIDSLVGESFIEMFKELTKGVENNKIIKICGF